MAVAGSWSGPIYDPVQQTKAQPSQHPEGVQITKCKISTPWTWPVGLEPGSPAWLSGTQLPNAPITYYILVPVLKKSSFSTSEAVSLAWQHGLCGICSLILHLNLAHLELHALLLRPPLPVLPRLQIITRSLLLVTTDQVSRNLERFCRSHTLAWPARGAQPLTMILDKHSIRLTTVATGEYLLAGLKKHLQTHADQHQPAPYTHREISFHWPPQLVGHRAVNQ
jgi:hypothetical protein